MPPGSVPKMKSNPTKAVILSSSQDIRNVLKSRDEASLQQGLTALRDRLTLKYNERVDVHDPRLQLLSTWLSSDEGAQTLFELWQFTNVKQHVILSLIVSILGNTISLLSSHHSYHELVSPIVSTLLSQQWILKLNTYLASTYNDLIIFTLKLWLSLSNFASGRMRKTLLDEFAWDLKTLPKLLHMRRKQKNDAVKNIMVSPDIRSLFVLFLLSFVDRSSTSSVKNAFLEQRRDLFASMFKGLVQDPYPLVRKVLEILWDGMWSDSKVRRSLKVAVFNENTVTQIIRLYDRKIQEGPDEDDIPSEVAHHFLLAICTRPGFGICFKDNGWYPREEGEDQSVGIPSSTNTEGSKVHNKILAGVSKSLRLSDDPRQRELARRILKACPELVAGFWSASSLTLEPRLSSTWIGNISFLNSVISEQPPTGTFLRGGEYRSSPPPLNAILDNIAPTSQLKNHLSRGLQSPSPLVQHCAAITVSKCLAKYLSVMHAFRSIQEVLQEDQTGLWTRRISELEREVRRRLPDLQVIVAFVQQRGSASNVPSTSQASINAIQVDLLVECSQRLLWLYHHALPSLFAESRFDVAKVLQVLESTAGAATSQSIPGLLIVRQLHALRLLKESDQFSWSGRTDSSRGNFSALLELYVATDVPVIQAAVGDVLKDGLAASLLFQHNPEEFSLWLDSLPVNIPGTEKNSSCDSRIVINLLDDCSQRCLKTPFKYLEELRTLAVDQDESTRVGTDTLASSIQPELLPGPLLMTVIEQFTVRLTAQKLNVHEVTAIMTYLRRLLLRLTCSVQSITILHPFVRRLLTVTNVSDLPVPVQQELHALCLGTRYPQPHSTYAANTSASSESSKFDFILPFQGQLWTTNEVQARMAHYIGSVNCWLALIHCADDVLEDNICLQILSDLFTGSYCNLVEFRRLLAVINQRLVDPTQASGRQFAVAFLTRVILKARARLNASDLGQLKQALFLSTSIKEYSSRPLNDEEREAFAHLVKSSLDPASSEDRKIVTEYASYWSNLLQTRWTSLDELEAKTSLIWISFFESEKVLSLLASLVDDDSSMNKLSEIVIEELLVALRLRSDTARVPLSQHISTFARLQSLLPESSLLEALLADALGESVSFLRQWRPNERSASLSQSLLAPHTRNSRVHSQVRILDITQILHRGIWTSSTARIVVSLIYLDAEVRTVVAQWLETDSFDQDPSHLAAILYALIDCSRTDPSVYDKLLVHFRTLVGLVVEQHNAAAQSSDALVLALRHIPSLRGQLVLVLWDAISGFEGIWNESLATLCKATVASSDGEVSKSFESVAKNAWKWAASLLTEPGRCSTSEASTLLPFVDLLKHIRSGSSVHSLADTVVVAAIQHHLAERKIVDFIHRTIEHLKPKPANTNRLLQSIIQHPRFYDLCQTSDNGLRESIIALLHFLFHLHPANTCQPSHVEPFGRLYGGTLAPSDLKLLSIFRLYEATRKASLVGLLARASHDPVDASHTLLTLDSGRVFRACLSFPQWRGMYGQEESVFEEAEVYDPVYIILLFAFWMKDEPPTSALAWVRMFRTNVVSLLIRSLSSHEESTRQAALVQLAQLSVILQDADFAERPHVLLVMDLLRDQIRPSPSDERCSRLPAYMTLHLAHSLRGIFYPSHFTYPLTARYLLQRPELDSEDVPMLLSMLYSSDDQWKQEQLWIMRFLADGLVGKKEWQIMSKRHTWDLVASQYRRLTDKVARHAVLELLARITCLPSPTYTLVMKFALLEWIEEQLRHIVPGEEIAWLKIIENIVVMLNSERSANRLQEWQHTVVRCLLKVLQTSSCQTDDLFRTIAILRRLDVSILIPSQVSSLVTSALSRLQNSEVDSSIPVDITEHFGENQLPVSNPPHGSSKLWVRTQADPFLLWGRTVEGLWQVALEAGSGQPWNGLTNRLLLWRGIVGEKNSRVGEWARRQMLEVLSIE